MVCIIKRYSHIGVKSDHKTSCVACHMHHMIYTSYHGDSDVCACSATGKRLMTKCRMLLQENQELGKQLSQGKIAQLEAEIALQKKYSQELKASQDGEHNTSFIYICIELEVTSTDVFTNCRT